jgi:MoaA/NifB/PqqE/SkfB family radical SAM enzyme
MSDKKNIAEMLKSFGLRRALNYLNSDPEKNIPKLLDWVIKLDKNNRYVGRQAQAIKDLMTDNVNWTALLYSLWSDIDDGVRKTIFENLIINASVIGGKRQDKTKEKNHCSAPWAILMDPTSACNLHCTGCWAAEYGNKFMDYDTLDSIIQQGKKLGVYFYLYSGGEPLIRKDDIIALCEKHRDCMFLAFTNGTLIDEDFADNMLRVKNLIPAISVEGFEAETDERRGAGTYQAIVNGMAILKRKKLPFGVSCCYTRRNTEAIGSEAFIDDIIAKGAKFAWFFTYIPVGVDAAVELIVTAEQRALMYHQLRQFRRTKPIFTLDFWNDGEYVGGCIAGGRRYLHINANGDIEPCAFIHYADSNIYERSLLEALQSPLFMRYRENQPFNNNHLRPCPLLDNAGCLANMVEATEALSTDLKNPENVRDLCAKCRDAAAHWAPVAEQLWEETPQEAREKAYNRAIQRK